MKTLLNLGMSDPLTLGMAHPIADRLETLSRSKTLSKSGRATALALIGGMAVLTAPFSVASDHPHKEGETRFKVFSKFNGEKGQSYEIVTEDGEKKAYRILKGGEREPAELQELEDGSYRLTYSDGETVDLPNFGKLEGLKSLESLKSLKSLEALSGLEGLKGLEGLEGLKGLAALDGIEFDSDAIDMITIEGDEIFLEGNEDFLAKFPEGLRDKIKSRIGSKQIKIVRNGDKQVHRFSFSDDEGGAVWLPDTNAEVDFKFFHSSDPLESAQRQLDIAKKQLEGLAEDETLSFDLKNALRDIESAQRSLDEAERRKLNEK